jgi:hypothetical protein
MLAVLVHSHFRICSSIQTHTTPCRGAFKSLGVPLLMVRVTGQFDTMLKLVWGPHGVYIVHFRVVVDGVVSHHAIMFEILEVVPGQPVFVDRCRQQQKLSRCE